MEAGVNIVPSRQPARAWPANIPLPACSSHATWFHHLELIHTLGSVLKGSGSRTSLYFYGFLPAALALWTPPLSISFFVRSVTKCYRNVNPLSAQSPSYPCLTPPCPPPPQWGALAALGMATGHSGLTRSSLEAPKALDHSS